MKKTLFSRLLKNYILVTLLSIVLASSFFYFFFSKYYFLVIEQQMISQGTKMAQMISPYVKNQDYNQTNQIINGFNRVNASRMWLINKDRQLIGGLEGLTNTDHLRPESDQLKRALEGEVVANRGKVKNIDDPVLSVALPITTDGQIVGAIFVCNPLSDITSAIIQTLKIVIYAGAITIIVVVFVSYFLSRSIIKPIKEITESSIEMTKGNFTRQAKVYKPDEIGKLAETFNYMMHTLDQTVQDLENEKNKMIALERIQREFVANASHELRTPLTSVRGYLEALLDGVINSKEQENKYLRIILKETLRLHRLVNSLLDLSRIESGQMKINKKELHLADIIDRVVMKLEPLAMDHQIMLENSVSKELPDVLGDEDLIEQILINYITNAIRFTPDNGKISLTAAQHKDEIHVHVKDTGIGIAPEEIPHIWKRFYKSNQTRPLSKEGAGLGLSLVKEIMERIDGRAWVESTLHQGSIFSFSLKVIDQVDKKVHNSSLS